MNNHTLYNTSNWFLADYTSRDIEMVNMVQSAVSCVATICIFVKVFDFGRFFKSIREQRVKHKKEKERRELERVRKLINSVKSNNDVNINELLSSGDDDETEENDAGVMKIARKKKNNLESKV